MTDDTRAAHVIAQAQVVLFDVEGTLVDAVPYVLESWRATLAAAGHVVTIDTLQRFSGMDGHDMLAKLVPGLTRPDMDRLLKQQRKRYEAEGLPQVKAFPDVRQLFESLHAAGKRIGLATDCSGDQCRYYAQLADVRDVVDASTSGDEVKLGKPHPDLVRRILRKLGIASGDAVIVGDTPFDVLAAQTQGVAAIGVLTGGFGRADLLEAGASAVVGDVGGLLNRRAGTVASTGAASASP